MKRRGSGYKNLKTVDRDTMNRIVHYIWGIELCPVFEENTQPKFLTWWEPSPSDFLLSFSIYQCIYQCNWKPKIWWSYHEKKKLNKYQSRDILRNTWIRFPPNVKAMKNKERYKSITIKWRLRWHGL